jgi:hypothetical protein
MEKNKRTKKKKGLLFFAPFIDLLFVTGRGVKVGESDTLIGLRVVDFDVI